MLPECYEEMQISDFDNQMYVAKQVQLLFQRALNFASFHGNGRAIEIVVCGADEKQGKAWLHCRVTETVLNTGD